MLVEATRAGCGEAWERVMGVRVRRRRAWRGGGRRILRELVLGRR
jgi:hypothetical protein